MKALLALGAAAVIGAAAMVNGYGPFGDCRSAKVACSIDECCPGDGCAETAVAAVKSDECCGGDPAKAALKDECCGGCNAETVAAKTDECGSCTSSCGGGTVVAAKTDECGSCTSSCGGATVVAAKTDECGSCTSSCGGGTVVAAKTDECGSCTSSCGGGTVVAAKTDECGSCTSSSPGTTVVAAVRSPAMVMAVGDEFTHCPEHAWKLAEKNGGRIAYVVRGVRYDSSTEASRAHVRQLQAYLFDITTPQLVVDGECVVCPVSASAKSKSCGKPVLVRVAGVDFDCSIRARVAAVAAIEAADAVNVRMKVGDRDCGFCSASAEAFADAEGKPIVYAVGDAEAYCPITAERMAMERKIQAAVAAAVTIANGGSSQSTCGSSSSCGSH